MENFDRQYRLEFGKPGSTGYAIGETSAEQPFALHIDFSIQKTEKPESNTGRVSVWNLNPTHLDLIKQKDCYLSLRAGYGNRLPLIFSGYISFSSTTMEDADEKTEIEVVDNLLEMRDTYLSLAYTGVVQWDTIFNDVASQLGVAISFSYNAKFVSVPKGFSYVGTASGVLDKGCACCNLTWSIQNGVLQIKCPNDVMQKEVFVLSPDSGLVGIPTRVNAKASETGETENSGWDVTYLLNGAIGINDYVKLESKIVTGYFRVSTLEMTGDNMQGDWICKARLMEVSG